MEVAVLVFLLLAVIVSVLVTRARGGFRRSWDDTDAWDALKRVGDEASKGNNGNGENRHRSRTSTPAE